MKNIDITADGMEPPMQGLRARLVRTWNRLAQVLKDRSGASAVEFAFLAPVLISIYISSFEITEGYNTAGKVLKAAGTVADVVARQTSVDKNFLNEMIDTAEATIAPHSMTGLTLKVTGVTIDSAGNAKVLWSWNDKGGAPYVKGSSVVVPSDMLTPSSFLIHAEVSVPHTLLLFLSSGAGMTRDARTITLSRDFFYRQRLGDDIPCTNCS